MKKLLSVLAVLLFSFLSFAQKGETVVMSGEDLSIKVADSLLYILPSYTDGLVIFKDGRRSKAPLNICTFDQSLMFIDNATGDTLALSDVDEVLGVYAPGRTFARWNSNFFVEIFNSSKEVSVALGRSLSIKAPKKEGIYGTNANNSAGVYSVTRFYDVFGDRYNLKDSIHVPWKYSHYILLYKNDKYYPANKKNILKLFPKKTDSINSYLDHHNTDFGNVEEVRKLVDYCLESL